VRTVVPGLWRRIRARPATTLIVLQLAAITVVGGVTVVRFHIFAAVDELAHVSFVQEVAEHGSLPWLGRSYVSWQMEAIEQDVYPRRSSVDPRQIGLAGLSYEAFQPPLYYLLAAPAFAIPGNYRDKVIAVRAFDLVLLLAAAAILALLARAVAAEHWQIAYAAALAVLLWPGVIVRVITVSNAGLELPLTLVYVLLVWLATARREPRLLLGAAAALGLCLLTGMTLIFLAPLLAVAIIALLRERRDRRALAVVALAVALPLLLLAPWVISNEVRYGGLTAGALAEQLQAPLVNPTGENFGVGAVISRLGRLDRALLPQEWWSQYGKAGLAELLWLLPALLLAGAVIPVLRRPRLLRSRAAALLASPLALGLITLAGIVVFVDWPSFLPRYINPTLPLLALFAAWAWQATRRRPGAALAIVAGSSALTGAVWFYMAGAYYFTNVGAALGIHAA
jgi:4-amino-4-deoxy-L-arabinose transferase-like glycosyltransferase